MSEAMVWTRKAGLAFLAAAAFWVGTAIGGWQETKQETKKESAEKKDTGKAGPETREYRLTLVVAASSDSSPVNRANVTVFYGEESREAPTGSDGRVTFKFTTAAKAATVRIRADRFNPYQAAVALTGNEIEHRAVLTRSN